MFQGRWPNTLNVDVKHRLTLPAVFRSSDKAEVGAEFMVGVLTDPCLYLHSLEQHDQFLERIYRQLGDSRESRRHKTAILSRFVPVASDANGRITIPAFLLDAAGIEKEVLLISQKTRVEIWGLQRFAQETGDEGLSQTVSDALEQVFLEEERELHTNNRGESPDGEG